MIQQNLLNCPGAVLWLRDVHLDREAPIFQSAVLYGPDEDPSRVVLYDTVAPIIDDVPVAIYQRTETGTLERLI